MAADRLEALGGQQTAFALLDPNLDPVRARRAFSHLYEHRLAAPFFLCFYFAYGSQPSAVSARIVDVLVAANGFFVKKFQPRLVAAVRFFFEIPLDQPVLQAVEADNS